MKIFIVGGKKEVYFLVKAFSSKGYQITVVNPDHDFCIRISRNFKVTVVHGDGSKPFVLEDGGIADSDIVIALTENDPDNLVICQIANKIYGIKKTFAVVSDPNNISTFKQLGVETVVSTSYIISSLIEQRAIVDDIQNLMPVGDGKIAMMEIDVMEGHPSVGIKVKDLNFPQKAIIGCIMRNNEAIIPSGSTEILKDDRLIILSEPGAQTEVLRMIRGRVD